MSKRYTITRRQITSRDIPTLLKWRNSDSFRILCTKRKTILSEADFRKELQEDFEFDRREQILISLNQIPAGTAFAYKYSKLSKHVFVSIFLDERFRGHAIGVYALAEYVASIFNRFDLFKIYFEVLSFNEPVVRLLRRLGLSIEGRLKGHALHDGVRHDLLVFALYQDVAIRVCARLNSNAAVIASEPNATALADTAYTA